jgi:hypothetical protein
MATAHEQQLAKDILVAWLSSSSTSSVSMEDLRDPAKAGNILADLYKTIVQAISETSAPVVGEDATG